LLLDEFVFSEVLGDPASSVGNAARRELVQPRETGADATLHPALESVADTPNAKTVNLALLATSISLTELG
jgi:hypothetical protein